MLKIIIIESLFFFSTKFRLVMVERERETERERGICWLFHLEKCDTVWERERDLVNIVAILFLDTTFELNNQTIDFILSHTHLIRLFTPLLPYPPITLSSTFDSLYKLMYFFPDLVIVFFWVFFSLLKTLD